MTVTSLSLKEYLERVGDKVTKKINLSIPFSLREPPKTVEEFQLKNNFAMLKVPLDLVTDFKSGLFKIKHQMDKLKTSLDPFGMYFMIKINSILPSVL